MAVSDPIRWMRQAIRLSKRGFPAPNPRVGCVIVREGAVVGKGYHPYAGAPHAEAMALTQAGESARGADVFVTLEPCNHVGRTPPCADALIRAGVRSVAIALRDPNPRVEGGGAERLKEAGIEVSVGLCEDEAKEANWVFHEAMSRNRPVVVLKAAMGLDGRVALPSGQSQWITSAESRVAGQRLRAELGAVLVGRGTVATDDPSLTARIRGVVNPPVRIVLDPEARLQGSERVFGPGAETLWCVAAERATEAQFPVRMGADGVDLEALLTQLGSRGVLGVLVEGGPRTITGFLRSGVVDWIVLFIAPKLLGAGKTWVEDLGFQTLDAVLAVSDVSVQKLGSDLMVMARVPRPL